MKAEDYKSFIEDFVKSMDIIAMDWFDDEFMRAHPDIERVKFHITEAQREAKNLINKDGE